MAILLQYTLCSLVSLFLAALCALFTLGCGCRSYVIQMWVGAVFCASLLGLALVLDLLDIDIGDMDTLFLLFGGYLLGMIPFVIGSAKMFFNDSPRWGRFFLVRLVLLPVLGLQICFWVMAITSVLHAVIQGVFL